MNKRLHHLVPSFNIHVAVSTLTNEQRYPWTVLSPVHSDLDRTLINRWQLCASPFEILTSLLIFQQKRSNGNRRNLSRVRLEIVVREMPWRITERATSATLLTYVHMLTYHAGVTARTRKLSTTQFREEGDDTRSAQKWNSSEIQTLL